jgi:putative spermidine/putrescine transport system substrate-binding protein
MIERLAQAAGGTTTRSEVLRRALLAGVGLSAIGGLAAACGSSDTAAPATSAIDTGAAGGTTASAMDAIIAGAKTEGKLNVIALPHDWANYGEIITAFKAKYGLAMDEANPNGSSADEITAVQTLKGQDRAPDVLDVSPAKAQDAANLPLFLAYQNSNWATIPDGMKEPTGLWVGDYYGVPAIGVNVDKAGGEPKSFADLKDPKYKNMVALNGDPRKSGSGLAGVWAASLANGGSLDDIGPGIDFFVALKASGNFVPTDATPATVQSGQTPITIDWDYLQLSYSKEFAGKLTWKVNVPTDGVYPQYYCQAINATAAHPNAAKLWQEFLYSDEGQLLFLKGFSHPARYADLVANNKVPADLAAQLPDASIYANIKFATAAQIDAAKAKIGTDWVKVAGS